MLECDAIKVKCKTREVIQKLMDARASGSLGSIGDVAFEPKETFLSRFTSRPVSACPCVIPSVDEIIVIGDIHGDLLSFVTALRISDVLDETYRLVPCAHSRVVIQMGDVIDRKVRSRTDHSTSSSNIREELDLMQMIYFLSLQAAVLGNVTIISLCGNHDVYNFGGRDARHLKQFSGMETKYSTPLTDLGFAHADGRPGRSDFFSIGPDSGAAVYMATTRPILMQVGEWLFVHGGLDIKTLQHFAHVNERRVRARGDLVQLLNETYRAVMLKDIVALKKLAADCTCPGIKNELAFGVLPRALCELIEYRAQGNFEPNEATCSTSTVNIGTLFELGDAWKRGHGGLCVSHTPQVAGVNGTCNRLVFRVDVGLSESFGRKSKTSGYPFQVLRILPSSNAVHAIDALTFEQAPRVLR